MKGYSHDLLRGKTVLITGASRGIGKACAIAAAECGATVIAVARGADDLAALTATRAGGIEAWVMDADSPALCERIAALGKLHGLVNNAGTNRVGLMAEQGEAELDAVLGLNVRVPWLVSRAALQPMARAGGGSIVHMSSQMGHVGSPRRTLYCMSKHAIEGLTKAMAVELAERGIRVNSVSPTFVETELTRPMLADPNFQSFVLGMIPQRKLASVDAVAAACIWLLSDLSANTTGTSLKVDGGWTAH